MDASIRNRLAEVRKGRGIAAADLAHRVGVSRQTIYAIEAGTYMPNTQVALYLARELGATVDELFSLPDGDQTSPEAVKAEVLSARPPQKGQPARIALVGSRWVGVPAPAYPCYISEADGIINRPAHGEGRADLTLFPAAREAEKRVVLAGCDPAAELVAHAVEKASGVEIVCAAASSKLALRWLKEGKVHIAGSHLEDAASREFNLPHLRRGFPKEDLTVVTYVRWEEGLAVSAGNARAIGSIEDLANRKVRFVNRERGSGARALLDCLLRRAGMDRHCVQGYDDVAYGHLAVAQRVASGSADVCLATRSAAIAFGLHFVPLHSERYDLIMRRETANLSAVQAFLEVLQRAALRRKLELLAGYDTSETGSVIAH